MSAPVDVLAVWDKEIEAFRTTEALIGVGAPGRREAYAAHLAKLIEARAAVAELIEASNEYFTGYCVDEADDDCATGSGFDTGCTLEQHEAAKRLRAALARVQGGAA